ncbi:hypothetical protein Moror_8209 [Moniliophthora roreri MCA 2997]|uniref:Protein kinase domain-containing protein n=1 Tax=Moniliophthora roreri (strain MCA 2997) TaxID=1381753 RepID=V2YRQ0_MONRO|nr:hypothetical protein Moror_8209 [Moniliophthora roreri MCA 2997]
MDYENELRRLQVIFHDEEAYRELLNQGGTLAQSLLDLLQLLIDVPDITTSLRASICTTMLRLSKASDLHPSCLTIQNVSTIGRHPVAGGGFGDIWKGTLGTDSGQIVCLKVIKMYLMSDVQRLLKEFLREAVVWRQLKHPNVLPCLGLYYLDNRQERVCLVSPWMENGNLAQFLRAQPSDSIDHLQLMHDIASGLSYLHTLKIVHGDLKGLNILMTPSHRACIADFGLSRVADSQLLKLTSSTSYAAGTARWSAPEVHMGHRATKESDIYSYGCVCYEIITRTYPYHELPNDAAVAFAVWRGDRPSRPQNIEIQDGLWSLMARCWEAEPASRPSIEDVLSSLVDLIPPGTTILPAEEWDSRLFTELRNNVDQSYQQSQEVTDFLSAIALKYSGEEQLTADTDVLSESLPDDEIESALKTPEPSMLEDMLASKDTPDIESNIRKIKKLCKKYLEQADGRIAFKDFAKGDLALFLPTRKPSGSWAAFNVHFPHHFLQVTESLTQVLRHREWIVARITSITERVAHKDEPSNDIYANDLPEGAKYYVMEVELEWSKPSSQCYQSYEAILKKEWTVGQLLKRAKKYRTQAKSKVSFKNFAIGDLALFLPTRNTNGAWAPFNVSFARYFLSPPTGQLAEKLKTQEWFLGKITSVSERVVDLDDLSSNAYGLAYGVQYFVVEVEDRTKLSSSSKERKVSSKETRKPDAKHSSNVEDDEFDFVIVDETHLHMDSEK